MPSRFVPLTPEEQKAADALKPKVATGPSLSTADKLKLAAAMGLRVAGPWAGGVAGGLGAAALLPETLGASGFAAPAMVAGGSALGGSLAEAISEKYLDPGHGKINPYRVAVQGGLSAVPGSILVKSGKPVYSALAGAGLGYAGTVGNKAAEGVPLEDAANPMKWSNLEKATGLILPAAVGAGFSKIGHGPTTPPPGEPPPPTGPIAPKDQKGLRLAAERIASKPKGEPVTPQDIVDHKALEADILKSPTGDLAKRLRGPKRIEEDANLPKDDEGRPVLAPPDKEAVYNKALETEVVKPKIAAEKAFQTNVVKPAEKADAALSKDQGAAMEANKKIDEAARKARGSAEDTNLTVDKKRKVEILKQSEADRKMRGAAEDQNVKVDTQREKLQGQALEDNKKVDEATRRQMGAAIDQNIKVDAKRADEVAAAAEADHKQALIDAQKEGTVPSAGPVRTSVKNGDEGFTITHRPPEPPDNEGGGDLSDDGGAAAEAADISAATKDQVYFDVNKVRKEADRINSKAGKQVVNIQDNGERGAKRSFRLVPVDMAKVDEAIDKAATGGAEALKGGSPEVTPLESSPDVAPPEAPEPPPAAPTPVPKGKGPSGPTTSPTGAAAVPDGGPKAELSPEVRQELENIQEEMQAHTYTKKTFNEVNRQGSTPEIVAGNGGAPVYDDIRSEGGTGTRGNVTSHIQNLLDGKINRNGLTKTQQAAINVAEARANGTWKDRGFTPPALDHPNGLSARTPPPEEGDVDFPFGANTAEPEPPLPEVNGPIGGAAPPLAKVDFPQSKITGQSSLPSGEVQPDMFGGPPSGENDLFSQAAAPEPPPANNPLARFFKSKGDLLNDPERGYPAVQAAEKAAKGRGVDITKLDPNLPADERGRPTTPARWAGAEKAKENLPAKIYAQNEADLTNASLMSPEDLAKAVANAKAGKGFVVSSLGAGQGGGIAEAIRNNPMFAARVAGGAAGAGIGAATDQDDPLSGAVVGGTAGALLPSAAKAFRGVNLQNTLERLPNIQRANYLSDPNGLVANSFGAPFGLGATTAAEKMIEGKLSGNPETSALGMEIAKRLHEIPKRWSNIIGSGRAANVLEHSPSNVAEALPFDQAKTPFDRLVALPATSITAGHMGLQDIGIDAGMNPKEAADMALSLAPEEASGNEQVLGWGQGLQNLKATPTKSKNKAIIANMMAPFTRTSSLVAAATPTRLPFGLGAIAKGMGEDVSWPQLGARTAVSSAITPAAFAVGNEVPPEYAPYVRKWVRNLSGKYGLVASAAFEAGLANQKGKNPVGSAINGLISGTPMPTAEIATDWGKTLGSLMSGDPKLPRSAVPAILQSKKDDDGVIPYDWTTH